MVGGAHGQTGRHVLILVVMVTEADKDPVTIPHPQEEAMTVMVTAPREKHVTSQSVQARKTSIGYSNYTHIIYYSSLFLKYLTVMAS